MVQNAHLTDPNARKQVAIETKRYVRLIDRFIVGAFICLALFVVGETWIKPLAGKNTTANIDIKADIRARVTPHRGATSTPHTVIQRNGEVRESGDGQSRDSRSNPAVALPCIEKGDVIVNRGTVFFFSTFTVGLLIIFVVYILRLRAYVKDLRETLGRYKRLYQVQKWPGRMSSNLTTFGDTPMEE